MSARRFEGKNVIVTGAGQGIGRAIADRFAEEGAEVLLIGRRRDPLDKAVREIEAAGGRLIKRGEHAPGVPFAYVRDPDGYLIELLP